MRKYLFPLFALVLGAAGFFVRRWQRAAAFEPETGLVTPDHPATAWLIIIALLVVAGGLLCGLSCLGYRTGEKTLTLGHGPVRVLLAVPAVGYLAAGALTIWEQLPLNLASAGTLMAAYLPVVLGLALVAGGGCMLAVLCMPSKSGEQTEGQTGRRAVTAMMPGFACCLMLVYYYHENASNPVVMDYMWMEFAMIAAMLAWYGFARLRFGTEWALYPCWYSMLCVALQMIPLADENPLPCKLVLLANLVWFTVRCGQLLDGLKARKAQA